MPLPLGHGAHSGPHALHGKGLINELQQGGYGMDSAGMYEAHYRVAAHRSTLGRRLVQAADVSIPAVMSVYLCCHTGAQDAGLAGHMPGQDDSQLYYRYAIPQQPRTAVSPAEPVI